MMKQFEEIGKRIAAGEAGQYEAAILWQELERLGSGEPPQPRCQKCGGSDMILTPYGDFLLNVFCNGCGNELRLSQPCDMKKLAQFFGPSAPSGSAGQGLLPDEWHLFHNLWTKAVGTPDYDKEQWIKLEGILVRFGSAGQEPPVWKRQESCSECDGDGCAKCEPEGRAESAADQLHCQECHEPITFNGSYNQWFHADGTSTYPKCTRPKPSVVSASPAVNFKPMGDCFHCRKPIYDNGTVAVHLIETGKMIVASQWCDPENRTGWAETEMMAKMRTDAAQPVVGPNYAELASVTSATEKPTVGVMPTEQGANLPVNNGKFCEHGMCCESCRTGTSGLANPPKVEEIAKQIAMECYDSMVLSPAQEIKIKDIAVAILGPFFTQVSQPPTERLKLAESLEHAAHCFYGEQYGDAPENLEMVLFAARFTACQLTGYKTEEEERDGAR